MMALVSIDIVTHDTNLILKIRWRHGDMALVSIFLFLECNVALILIHVFDLIIRRVTKLSTKR